MTQNQYPHLCTAQCTDPANGCPVLTQNQKRVELCPWWMRAREEFWNPAHFGYVWHISRILAEGPDVWSDNDPED